MRIPDDSGYTPRHAGEYVPGPNRLRIFLVALLALLLAALVAWPFVEPWSLQVETVTLSSTDLPAAIGQMRIVYLTDIHMGEGFTPQRMADLVKRINAMDADLVLLGGDYATDSDGAIAFFRDLPQIRARYGVFAVLGNHDRTQPESNLSALRTTMLAAGVTPLVNETVPVRIGNATIWLAGVDDVNCGHPELAAVASRVKQEDYVIFLCHSPAVISDALGARDANYKTGWFDLGLFGHTHGGQVALFGGLIRDESVPDKYHSGWTRVNRIDLLTSRGVGTAVLPIRLLCTPQIHLITVKALN